MRDKGGEHPETGRHSALAELAERQHGVVSIRQLTGPLGYSKAAVHRAVTLAHREDRALREGIPVTSLPRTLLDLAATVRSDWLEKMVERSEDLELFDLRAVEDLLDRTVGHHGHGRLRKAIALYKPSSFTRSTLERRFLELCLDAGLPQPRTNYVEHGFELDCYWPECRFAVELDLYETHGTRAAFERDRKRQEDLLLDVVRRVARLLYRGKGAPPTEALGQAEDEDRPS
jgi:hypothetical protein